MFQVPTHPTSLPAHGYRDSGRRASSSHNPAVQLPLKLSRPEHEGISMRALVAASPVLSSSRGITPEYIQHGLLMQSRQLLAGLNSLSSSHIPSSLPKSHLPSVLPVPVRSQSSSVEYPTHALAVFTAKNPEAQAVIVPVHALVIASHCARFPEIRAPPSRLQGQTLQLPVIPFTLPSPGAFTVLVPYLYSHRPDQILKSLFPMPSGFIANYDTRLAKYLCEHDGWNLQRLMTHTSRIRDVWQDVVALGIHDPALWDIIDLTWEVVLTALNLAASNRG